MRKAIISLAITLALSSHALGLDSTSLDTGSQAGQGVRSQLGDTTAVDNRLQKPLTTNVPLTTMDNLKSSTQSTFCGQSTVQNEQQAVQVTVTDTGAITIATDSDGDGSLNSTASYTATKICIDGYQVGLPPTAQYFIWQASGGVITTSPVTALNGCMDPTANPATYVGGSVSQKWADSTGRVITKSSLVGDIVTYYAGTTTDCQGTTTTPSATKYYDNPYTMNDAAIQKTIVCNMNSTDPACRAYASTRAAQTNVTGQTQSGGACSIERTINDTTTHSPGDPICEPNRIYYPGAYTNANPTCFKAAGDKWNYNQQFRFKCDPYGQKLTLEAWAWWEGAPCGSQQYDLANYPPQYQVTYDLPYGGNSATDTIIGQLSVNRRTSDNLTHVDTMNDISCYSDDANNPLKIHMTYACENGDASCTYNFTIENSLACPVFSYTHVPPPAEQIIDNCTSYKNCSIQSETWYDATGGPGVQTIKDGTSVNNQTQVYDATSPYSPLPITCKNFTNVGTVCKDWWRKDRTYKCEGSYNKNQPYLTRAQNVMENTTDNNVSNFAYPKSVYNKENTPKCILEVKYTSNDIPNCYANGLSITCPKKYNYNGTDHVCTRDPSCSPYGYDLNANRCQYDPGPTPICKPEFPVYNSTTNKCEGDAVCTTGQFHDIHNRCELNITPSCPSTNYTFHGELVPQICTFDETPPCPTNYAYDNIKHSCQPTAALCPSPPGTYTPPPDAKCTSDFTCSPTDTPDPANGKCFHTAGKTCYPGYQKDNTDTVCFKPEGDCSYGTWNPTYGKCTGDREYICQSGFTIVDGTDKCITDPKCPLHNNKTVNYASGCTTTREMSCQAPYTPQSGVTGDVCASTPTCPTGLDPKWVPANNRCEITGNTIYKCSVPAKAANTYQTEQLCESDCNEKTACIPAPQNTYGLSPGQSLTWMPGAGALGYTISIDSTGTQICLNGNCSSMVGGFTGAIPNESCSIPLTMDVYIGYTNSGNNATLDFSTGCQLHFKNVNFTGGIPQPLEFDFSYPECCYLLGYYYKLTMGTVGPSNFLTLQFNDYWTTAGWRTQGYISARPPGYTCPYDTFPGEYTCDASLQCQRPGTCSPHASCTAPYTDDAGTCVASGICPNGQPVTLVTHRCEKTPTYTCYLPYTDTGSQCQATPTCDYNAPIENGKCTLTAALDCSGSSHWNAGLLPAGLCEADATCPNSGQIQNLRCETPLIPDCTMPYVADSTGTKCIKAVDCPIGQFDMSSQKCIMKYSTTLPTCPDGGHFDSVLDRCYQVPLACPTGSGMYPDYAESKCWGNASCGQANMNLITHKCEYTPDICLKDWLYDVGNKRCYKEPGCPYGAMNYTKDRCEATPICQKTIYPEMDCIYDIPSTKTNLQCKANDPIPNCSVAPVCPMGGEFNGSICTVTPNVKCPNPYEANAPNCTAKGICPPVSGQPITMDYTAGRCRTAIINGCTTPYTLKDGQCQLENYCGYGTYNGTECLYTPTAKYVCPGATQLWDDPVKCKNDCKAHFSVPPGSGMNPCSATPWSITASGNTLIIGNAERNAVIGLVGFTATGGTGPIQPCIGCSWDNRITIGPKSEQWMVETAFEIRQGNPPKKVPTDPEPGGLIGTIQLTGAYAYTGMQPLTIYNGVECTAVGQDVLNLTPSNGNLAINGYDILGNSTGIFPIWPSGTITCDPYSQCPDATWEKKTDGLCHKILSCPLGGNWQQIGANWVCVVNPDKSCPTNYGIVDPYCETNLTCPNSGLIDSTLQACKAPAEYYCPTSDYTMDNTGQCIGAAQCPTGGKPSGGSEISRRVYQKCIDPRQCDIKCSVRVGGSAAAAYTEGYYIESRLCTDNGSDSYSCPLNAGDQEEKPCACVADTWNQSLTDPSCTNYAQFKDGANKTYIIRCRYDSTGCKNNPTDCMSGQPFRCSKISSSDTPTTFQPQELCCEPSCTVTKTLSIPETNSVVKKEYEVRQCTSYNNSIDALTCPVQTGETIDQDCMCIDKFAMTAGIFSAIVETAKDRVCEP